MDQTLDDIIATRPKTPRRTTSARRPTSKAQVLGTSNSPITRARAAPATNGAKGAVVSPTAPMDKIIVSNLPPDVNEQQIRDLFSTTVGPLKEVTLNYDSKGVSKGVASVHFSRRGDGNKAYQQYNNRLIDGKRPMKIEIIVDPSRAPAPSLAARVAPPPTSAPAADGAARNGARPRRGRGGGRRRNERPAKTAADLDAEMEDYTSNNATAAATA